MAVLMTCPRCGGWTYLDAGVPTCLQCGRPLVPIVPLPLVKTVKLAPTGKEAAR